jgi:hypothetical protein
MSDGGKGSKPRPFSVDQETFENNFDRIFGKKNTLPEYELNKSTGEVQKVDDNTGVTQNEYQDILSTEDCIDDLEKYKLEAQGLWNDSCTSYRKK